MRFRLVRAVAALSLVFTGVVATDAVGARPELIDSPQANVKPVFQPYGLANGMITLVVQLTGDPVAVRQANAGGTLTDAEIAQIEAQLKAQQDRVAIGVQALGGTVIATYQSAYNGVKIRIGQDKFDQLMALPNVQAVRTLQVMKPDNTKGVPFIGAPTVWQNSSFRGERVKIAIIDTGIDYTHANFGGPGTEAAYDAAHANEAHPANPDLFGPRSHTRVKGGIDLVGDSYNADSGSPDYQPIPHPDPNPLDCNGHGSHVAGSAAGSGVLTGGVTFTGPYNASTISGNTWIIGPGVAPRAELYAVRVFGCGGSTDVTVDAIEWAVKNKMDVINMSLGSVFGSKDDPSAEASTNAVKAGVVVVASAGNSGGNQYMTGSPATGDGALSVAASDPSTGNPGAIITHTGGTATAMNANGHPLTGLTFPMNVKAAVNNPATLDRDESLGCSVSDITWDAPVGPNTLVVVNRGVCARVAKAIFGQQAGAVAVVMVNNDTVLPPFEGPITSNPDDGVPYTVTIPFLGVKGLPATATSDGGKMRAATSVSNITSTFIPNTAFSSFASFSSGGPRTGDSFLKPEITAPGVSTVSTGMGTGTGAAVLSGTSMASPHVAGVAALTRQAHPSWSAEQVKAAIVNTGSPAGVAGTTAYRVSRGGTGLVQPVSSTTTQVVAGVAGDKFVNALNFGYTELLADFKGTKVVLLTNKGSTAAKFTAATGNAAGRPHTVSINTGRSPTITVPAGGTVSVPVTLSVPVATVLASNASGLNFREVAGNIVFTPVTGADNAGVTLRVPYYLVPRALSNIATSTPRLPSTPNPSVLATITNKGGAIAGDADFYAWGLQGTAKGDSTANIKSVGVQAFDFDGTQNFLGFAVNTGKRWSNPSVNEFDIYVDVNGDGIDDYIVVGVDQGAVQTGVFNGRLGSFVFSTRSDGASINFFAQAPTDSSSTVIFVLSSQLCRTGEPCLNAANPRITYHAIGFDIANGGSFTVPGKAKFNAWSSAISQGDFVSVAPNATDTSVHISINSAEWAVTPALGSMILSIDNKSGTSEAQLIKFSPRM